MNKTLLTRTVAFAMIVGLGAPIFSGCTSTATRESAGEYIDDSIITARVKTALARNPVVNAFAVNVETFRGAVQLSGFVDTEEQKQQAGTVASSVSGVQSVINNVTVKTAAAPSQPMPQTAPIQTAPPPNNSSSGSNRPNSSSPSSNPGSLNN